MFSFFIFSIAWLSTGHLTVQSITADNIIPAGSSVGRFYHLNNEYFSVDGKAFTIAV
eukprot:Pgem_evm2s5579